MLTSLKAKMHSDVEFKSALETSLEYISENDSDIKDIFLNDPDAMVIGAENDPEIAKLVDSLPDVGTDEVDPVSEEDINNIEDVVEHYVPASVLTEDVCTTGEDNDPGDEDDIKFVKDTSKADVGEDQDDIEDAPDKDPKKINPKDADLGENQDDIEDAPDHTPTKENSEEFDDDYGIDEDDFEYDFINENFEESEDDDSDIDFDDFDDIDFVEEAKSSKEDDEEESEEDDNESNDDDSEEDDKKEDNDDDSEEDDKESTKESFDDIDLDFFDDII